MAQGKTHKPTVKSRAKVKHMAAAGCAEKLIATVMEISRPTLRKHYVRELKTAKGELRALAGASLVRLVRQGCFQAVKMVLQQGDPTWSERHRVEHAGEIQGGGVAIYEAGPVIRLPNNHRDDPAAVAGKNGDKPRGDRT